MSVFQIASLFRFDLNYGDSSNVLINQQVYMRLPWSRVLLLQSERGIPIDVSLGALPFEERVVERATFYRFLDNVRLNTCSAEDLIVLKAFADRSRDWSDIEGVLLRTGHRLAWKTVEAELPPLCEAKEAPHIMPRLGALRSSLG